MSKVKINIKDKKGLGIKFDKEVTISTKTFKKGEEYKLDLDDVNDQDVSDLKHDEVIPKDKIKFTGKLHPKKAEGENDAPQAIEVEVEGKFGKGYFWDSLEITKVEKGSEGEKLEKTVSVKTGGDLWGFNYYGWVGVLVTLALIIAGGYYWWTSYNKEEEEENL